MLIRHLKQLLASKSVGLRIMDVLVFGSAIVDFICYVDRLPKAGETLHGHKFTTGYGGKGANQCVAAARLGAKTAMIAKVGDDAWGADYVANMQREGVDVGGMEVRTGETTGIAQICVSAAGENHIVIVAGANNSLSETEVTRSAKMFKSAKILICQLETPISATLKALESFKGISILNAAPALANIPNELLKAATILCVNESEAALITGCIEISNLEQAKVALRKLIEIGANTVIITLGALGAVYSSHRNGDNYVHVPTKRIERVVDTTGAGDAFIGALAYYMAKFPDLPLYQQIGAACNVASYSVRSPGTQSSFPTTSQIDSDLRSKEYAWHSI